jgi:hypothetical protein
LRYQAQFFSRQLLFGRFESDEPVMSSLFPAFKEYLDYYSHVIKSLNKDKDHAYVKELHRAYDQYSAEKDPAVGKPL